MTTIAIDIYHLRNNVKVISAQQAPSNAIDACLNEMAQRDLFMARRRGEDVSSDTWVVLIGDDVAGLGWARPRTIGTDIDVRVLPRFRKQGVGSALFDAVTDNLSRPWFASCDAGQTSAIEFLDGRGFKLDGAVYAQRWDGCLDDVPPAFMSATIEKSQDLPLVNDILSAAYGTHWLQPNLSIATDPNETLSLRIARRDGQAVGALVTMAGEETIVVAGLGTVPHARQKGVGRALLCDLMKEAAHGDLGVAARIPAEDEHTAQWTRGLGFWTYRTWVYFSCDG